MSIINSVRDYIMKFPQQEKNIIEIAPNIGLADGMWIS